MEAAPKSLLIFFWTIATISQFFIAVCLLAIHYGDSYGLAQVVENGEKIVLHLSQSTQSGSETVLSNLFPVLATSNNLINQLSELLGWAGIYLLICTIAQAMVAILFLKNARSSQQLDLR